MPAARRLALVGTWMFVGGLAAFPILAVVCTVVRVDQYAVMWIILLALLTTVAGGLMGLVGVLADRDE